MNAFLRHAVTRNALWVTPLALPAALLASTTVELALLFGVVIAVTVPLAHLVSWPIERWLPRYVRLVVILVIASVIITLAETVIRAGGYQLAQRPLYVLRALTVSGLVVYPSIASPLGQRFSRRMAIVAGTVVGFLGGFFVFAALRIAVIAFGFVPGDSLAFGFLLLALGRIAINAVKWPAKETEEPTSPGAHR